MNSNELYMVVGTYSPAEKEGIHLYRFNQETGVINHISSMSGITNPSYLAISANGNYIYAVGEEKKEDASVNAISFNKNSGKLSLINTIKLNEADPCYISIDNNRRIVVTANYSGGSLSVVPFNPENGKLFPVSETATFSGSGTDRERQDQPHVHTAIFSPDMNYLLATDLGTDKIYVYSLYEEDKKILNNRLDTVEVKPRSGPRHLEFHPNGKFVYLINELSGMVTVFTFEKGKMDAIQYILADSLNAGGSADIHISPNGNYLYVSNRLQGDGIVIFSIDNTKGSLTNIGYHSTSDHPRDFIISPNGEYLLVACRDDNVIEVYAIDSETGLLHDTGIKVDIDKPVCIKLMI